MSIGGPEPSTIVEDAIDYAIENGVIVVAAAGNEGLAGMGWPGAYPQVISVGACGWEYEWYFPDDWPLYRLWWLQDDTFGYRDIAEPTPVDDVYMTSWSSRENQTLGEIYETTQQLDVVAPGSWVRGPFPGYPAYNHLPWWARGRGWIKAPPNLVNLFYVGGTSMSTPHASAVAALMLEKNPNLMQSDVEYYLRETALPLPYNSGMWIFDLYDAEGNFAPGMYWYEWGESEATGSGLIQADAAVTAVP